MPFLPTSLKDLNGLPPAVADYFRKQEDGTYAPNIDPASGFTLEQVGPLRKAIETERETVRRLRAVARDFGRTLNDDGHIVAADDAIDPQEAREAIRKVREGKVTDKSATEREQAMEAKFKADLQKKVDEYEARFRNDDADHITATLARILTDSGAPQGSQSLLMSHLREKVKVERDDKGRRRISVLDEHGRVRVSQKFGSAEPMGPEELITGLKQDRAFAALWPSTGAGGSGANHSSGGSARAGNADPNELSGQQLLSLARGHRT